MKRCTKCRKQKVKSKFSRANCSKDGLRFWCKSCDIESAKNWYEANRERHREAGRRYWMKHKKRLNKIQRELLKGLRCEFINAYGGKCQCCGESEKMFLTIEHINGRGSEERKRLGSYQLLVKLRRLGWPKENHTILCFNCNLSKGFFGFCPHKGE